MNITYVDKNKQNAEKSILFVVSLIDNIFLLPEFRITVPSRFCNRLSSQFSDSFALLILDPFVSLEYNTEFLIVLELLDFNLKLQFVRLTTRTIANSMVVPITKKRDIRINILRAFNVAPGLSD